MVVPTKVSSRKHSRQQGAMLEKWLVSAHNIYPSKEEKLQLASTTEMSYHQVNRWFANKRRKLKMSNSTSPTSDRVFSPAETEPAYSPSPQISPADDCEGKNSSDIKQHEAMDAFRAISGTPCIGRPCPMDLSKNSAKPPQSSNSPFSKLSSELEMFWNMCLKDSGDVVRMLQENAALLGCANPLAAFDACELQQRHLQSQQCKLDAEDQHRGSQGGYNFYGCYPQGLPPVSSPFGLGTALFPQATLPNATLTGVPSPYGYRRSDMCTTTPPQVIPPATTDLSLLSPDVKSAVYEYLNRNCNNLNLNSLAALSGFDPSSQFFYPCKASQPPEQTPTILGDSVSMCSPVTDQDNSGSLDPDTDILIKETIAISVLASFALQKKSVMTPDGQEYI